jgi:hypothetical protein
MTCTDLIPEKLAYPEERPVELAYPGDLEDFPGVKPAARRVFRAIFTMIVSLPPGENVDAT